MRCFVVCENCGKEVELQLKEFNNISFYNDIHQLAGGWDEDLPYIKTCCTNHKPNYVFKK